MTNDEKPKFVLAIEALAASFRAEVTEAMFEGYWLALDDLDLNAVGRAVKRAMRECKFMPSARELRELAGELRSEHRAVLAWDAFESAVIRHGGYASVDFDDPLINATIRHLGGWRRVCELSGKEFDTFLKKDFERVYAALCASGVASDRCTPLLGIHASENALNGFPAPKPAKVLTGLPSLPAGLIRGPSPAVAALRLATVPAIKSPDHDQEGF